MSLFLLILEFVVTKFYITRWKNLKHNELPSKKIYTHTQIRSYLCVNLIRRENIQTQSIHKNISTSTILHTSIQAHKFVLPHYPCVSSHVSTVLTGHINSVTCWTYRNVCISANTQCCIGILCIPFVRCHTSILYLIRSNTVLYGASDFQTFQLYVCNLYVWMRVFMY